MTCRTDIADRLWEHVSGTLFCSKEQYVESLSMLDVTEGSYGVRVSNGPEFHWMPCGKLNKAAIRECIQPLIDRFGYAVTRTSDARQKKFNERIGFYRIGENDDETLYRIDAIAF